MKKLGMLLVLGLILGMTSGVPAQPEKLATKANKDEEALHQELRALREGLTDAVLKGDIERQLQFVHKNVVVTWQNGEVVRGHDGLKEFLAKNQGTANKVFRGYKEPPTPTELTILYGHDTGITFGTSVAQYRVLGKEFELRNHWTATLVKEDGRWQIASYHVSTNVLNNPLLNAATTSLYWGGGIALVVGVLVGFVAGRFLSRARSAAP